MRVGQPADVVGTTPRAVRHYHRLGLFEEPQHLPNVANVPSAMINRMMRIRWLVNRGVPLASYCRGPIRPTRNPPPTLRIQRA
ncbi:MerR family transcriptional regulator [Rhodococcus zopfii]|uniref:MerR family transcriptional regulator n=1 Tax=Rhodococcus zopfii TaxID=43772 RepID=UPI000B1FCE86